MTLTDLQPVGYRIEYKSGDYCFFFPLKPFAAEANRLGGRIHSLHSTPQPGCDPSPVGYYNFRAWCDAKHWRYNSNLLPEAKPAFIGPDLHDPEAGQ